MVFDTRDEFINAQSSEKITLAHVHATTRLIVWLPHSGNIYKKTIPNFVTGIAIANTAMTEVTSIGAMTSGTFYYDPQTGEVYIWDFTSQDPANLEVVATYRFFYANTSVVSTADLTDLGPRVQYVGRIEKSPGYKHLIGIDQKLTSLVGSGDLILQNTDGAFDDIYDTIFFENQEVSIYSWNRDLPFSAARVLFRGKVTDKAFNSRKVTLKIKDSIFDLAQNVPQAVFDDNDNVTDAVKGNYKRWIYGRVDGLHLQSVDQIGDGYLITGTGTHNFVVTTSTIVATFTDGSPTVTGTGIEGVVKKWDQISVTGAEETYTVIGVATNTLTLSSDFSEDTIASVFNYSSPLTVIGTGTSFLADCSPDDSITIGTQEFTIDEVVNDTQLLINKEPSFSFTGLDINLKPDIPTSTKNRTFYAANHACAELTKQVVNVKQLNRVQVNNTTGLLAGDFVEFENGERIEIKKLAPGNIIVLRQNLVLQPAVGEDVVRQPVQQVFIETRIAESADFSIANSSAEMTVTLTTDAEFNLSAGRIVSDILTFTNASRTITGSGTTDLREILKPRDWIRPEDLTYTTYYEILSVEENEVKLRTNFTEPTVADAFDFKSPNYIGDDTVISADVLGRTEDNTPSGEWIKTAPQVVADIMKQIGITNLDAASFAAGEIDNPQIVSMPVPLSPGATSTTVKTVVDEMARATLASITLNKDLNIRYTSLLVKIPDEIETIHDKMIKGWGVEGVNSNIFRNSIVRYRHKDIDRASQESGNSVATFSSEFVRDYIGTDRTNEVDARLYLQKDAQTRANREVYLNRLSRAKVNIRGDLRLERFEIGQAVKVSFRRLYKRLGDGGNREKVLVVMGKTVTGTDVTLLLSDVGNVYNTSSIITPNTAPDYATSSADEKLKYGYITDAQGVVDNDEDTSNVNLIS